MDVKASECVISEPDSCGSAVGSIKAAHSDRCRPLGERTAVYFMGACILNPKGLEEMASLSVEELRKLDEMQRLKAEVAELVENCATAHGRVAELEEQLETLRNNILLPGTCYALWLSLAGWSPGEILRELGVSSIDDLEKGCVDEYDIEQLSEFFDEDGKLI